MAGDSPEAAAAAREATAAARAARGAAEAAAAAAAAAREAAARKAAARAKLTRWLVRCAALLGVFAIELAMAGRVGPYLYYWMQEDHDGTGKPQLLPTAAMLVALTAAVVLLTIAASTLKSAPRAVRLMGSTTLGTYVLHMYFTLPFSMATAAFRTIPHAVGDAGLGVLLQLLLLLLLPVAFQLTLGLAFHRLMMLEFKLVFRLARVASAHAAVALRHLRAPPPPAPAASRRATSTHAPPRAVVDAGVPAASSMEMQAV